jgi:cyclase
MLKKRVIISLTFLDGILFRTKQFNPDYRYTKEFINMWNIDELILIDISKKKFSDRFIGIVKYFSSNCFVPISVGGGIETVSDAKKYFIAGADKVILGFRGLVDKNLNKSIAEIYGNQSLIQALDFKKVNDKYMLFSESGKNPLNIDILDAILINDKNFYGEIFLNNILNDGNMMGFDIDLVMIVEKIVNCPLIAVGGGGNWDHFVDLFKKTSISAACTQNIYHFTEKSISALKKTLIKADIKIRI